MRSPRSERLRPSKRRPSGRRNLAALQHWMQAVIVHPRPAAIGVRSKQARAAIAVADPAEVVRPSRTMTPLERVDVYGGMYYARLGDALKVDFPVLAGLLGDAGWHQLANKYLQKHPSTHPNLNFLGRHLPGFLRRPRGLRNGPFLADLAALEWAVAECFMAPEGRRLLAEDVARVPADAWAAARLVAGAHLRLLSLRHPANRFFIHWKEHGHADVPRPASAGVAVYRKDDRVWRMELTPGMHRVLAALVAGVPLGKAVALARGEARAVGGWFQEWVGEGFFAEVALAPESRA
jgi:hypothetical protein